MVLNIIPQRSSAELSIVSFTVVSSDCARDVGAIGLRTPIVIGSRIANETVSDVTRRWTRKLLGGYRRVIRVVVVALANPKNAFWLCPTARAVVRKVRVPHGLFFREPAL